MKNVWLILFFPLIIGMLACNTDPSKFCDNGELDSNKGETEIDCGGECEACPPAATMSATVLGAAYHGASFFVYNYFSGNPIEFGATGTAGANLTLQFVGTELNTNLPITDAEIRPSGEQAYNFELADTGSVRLTSHDPVRHIISGTFSFSVRKNGNDITTVSDGTFANVRYSN